MGKFLFFASFCVLFFAGCPQPQPVIIERPREEPRHEIVVPPQPNRNVIVAPQFGVVPRPYYGRPYYGQPHYAPPPHREPYAPNRQPYGGGNRGDGGNRRR